ncbi:hypothetical protein JOD64_004706 [Micromonospora luteifusca]|uniref:Uncharacterized protein n=1 Tax=Micromonospora luteifusca TaxID=709860 RepID=A0ABS2LZ58_9ACTN|nr:hypothetical protein [Micromonospora luteifusca]
MTAGGVGESERFTAADLSVASGIVDTVADDAWCRYED